VKNSVDLFPDGDAAIVGKESEDSAIERSVESIQAILERATNMPALSERSLIERTGSVRSWRQALQFFAARSSGSGSQCSIHP